MRSIIVQPNKNVDHNTPKEHPSHCGLSREFLTAEDMPVANVSHNASMTENHAYATLSWQP